jgi:hypothetical protein
LDVINDDAEYWFYLFLVLYIKLNINEFIYLY